MKVLHLANTPKLNLQRHQLYFHYIIIIIIIISVLDIIIPVMLSSLWPLLQWDLSNGDLSNGDLSNGDLSNGDLSNGDLSNGDLSNGDLSNGDLSNGDTIGAIQSAFIFYINCALRTTKSVLIREAIHPMVPILTIPIPLDSHYREIFSCP
jgi:uncharacterized protein YjbI with pentapeptide repeats